MNRDREKAMFAQKSLLKPIYQKNMLEHQMKASNYLPITPQQKGLDGKPLETRYRTNFDNLTNVLYRNQVGIPKLDKKQWYQLSGYEKDEGTYLKSIYKKKSHDYKPDDGRGWQREKKGVYWSGDDDYATRFIHGKLLTQEQLTQAYKNSLKTEDNADGVIGLSPIQDSMAFCNCGESLHGNQRDSQGRCICGRLDGHHQPDMMLFRD